MRLGDFDRQDAKSDVEVELTDATIFVLSSFGQRGDGQALVPTSLYELHQDRLDLSHAAPGATSSMIFSHFQSSYLSPVCRRCVYRLSEAHER
jgi:hypothetical protein